MLATHVRSRLRGAHGHLLHQALDAARHQEARRRLRLRVVRGDRALQGDQAGDLVLLVLRVMHPRPGSGGAGA
jgi:hypothetical protein